MDADDMINKALGSEAIMGEGLFILEGHPERNLFRILPADEAFKMNLNAFTYNINTGFQYMGIYTTEKQAQQYIDKIRERLRDEEGNRLV
jgi:hypothetical protein